MDWLRDSILNENRDEFDTALNDLRRQLDELEALVACRGANITRLRIWSSKRYLLNQLHSSINSVAVPHPQ